MFFEEKKSCMSSLRHRFSFILIFFFRFFLFFFYKIICMLEHKKHSFFLHGIIALMIGKITLHNI